MAPIVIGDDSIAGQDPGAWSAGDLVLTKHTLSGATAGMTWKKIRIRVEGGAVTTNVRAVIYGNSGGAPGPLLDWVEFSVAGFSTETVREAALTAGAAATNGVYWLGFHVPSSGVKVGVFNSGSTVSRAGGASYGAAPPNPAGTTFDFSWYACVEAECDAPAPAAPAADFTGTPVTGVAPVTVAFTDTSTGAPTSWAWTFGDGGTATAQNPTYEYTAAGVYTVTLVATNAGGSDTETKTAYVIVDAPPPEPPDTPPGALSIAFDADPMTPDPAWTRIDTLPGCRVSGWTIDRGRPDEFSKTDTGTAVVRIVDRQGLFDPTNPGSPYHDKILPGKQATISLRNPISDVWHTLFRGFVESWRYRLEQTRQVTELELQLVDGFAILARAELQVGEDGAQPPFDEFPAEQTTALEQLAQGNVLYGETAAGHLSGTLSDRIYAILGDVGWPVELAVPTVDVFSGNVRVGPKAYGPGTSALDALWDAADAEFPGVASMWIGGPSAPGHLVFHGRYARFHPDVAEYRIERYTVGDPSATTLDDDAVPVSELEWSNGQDNLYNAASATPQGVGSGSVWRPLDPELDDVAGQYVKDDASIEKYGLRSITFDNLQTIHGIASGYDSMQETRQFAVYYVENYKNPAPRISRLVFKSRRPGNAHGAALWQFVCNVDISDLLTLKTAHPGGGGFDQEFYVEGIHYDVQPGPPEYPHVVLSLDVSPRANWTHPFDEDAG